MQAERIPLTWGIDKLRPDVLIVGAGPWSYMLIVACESGIKCENSRKTDELEVGPKIGKDGYRYDNSPTFLLYRSD